MFGQFLMCCVNDSLKLFKLETLTFLLVNGYSNFIPTTRPQNKP